MDLRDDDIEKLIRVTNGDPFIVEIGAMDGVQYDALYPYITRYDWRGLLVEPLADMFERLRANYSEQTRLIFENVAITETPGDREIYRIEAEGSSKAQLPEWSEGLSSFFLDRNAIGWKAFDAARRRETVRCCTLPSLLDKHRIDRIDLLQIDTEGYDLEVLRQVDFETYSPYILKIEAWVKLPEVRQAIESLLRREGYTLRYWGSDIIATRWSDEL